MRLISLFLLMVILCTGTPLLQAESPSAVFVYEFSGFDSLFPNGIASYLDVMPTEKLVSATMFLSMDGNIMFTDEIEVPEHEAGAALTLKGEWNGLIHNGEPCPPWAIMQIWWRLIDAAGNAIYTEPLQELYKDVNRNWQHTSGEYMSAYTYDQPEILGQTAIRWGDNAFTNLQASYGYELPYRPVFVFYNDPTHGAFDLGYADWEPFAHSVYARTYPGTNTMITLTNGGYEIMRRVVPHEMAHLYQMQMGALLFDAPLWWIEGDARAQEPAEQRRLVMENVLRYASYQQLPALILWDSRPASSPEFENMMDIGASFVLFLEDQYGIEGHARLYEAWHTTGRFESAFFLAFDKTLAELEQDWRRWLARYEFP